MSRATVYVRLGRVSNLPTVVSNVIAGVVLGGASPHPLVVFPLALGAALVYVAGMFLNDAFDRRVDARERPERPIPSGQIGSREVFGVGAGLLAAGVLLIALLAPPAAGTAVLLACTVVAYDAWHKGNPAAPALMAACRALVYAMCAVAVAGHLPLVALVGALALGAYVLALTHLSRRRWPGPLVARLIAGISLLDAVVVAAAGGPVAAALACAAGFPLTLALQRRVAGT